MKPGEEIEKAKIRLADDIFYMIRDFNEKHGCMISSINLRYASTVGCNEELFQVALTVEI